MTSLQYHRPQSLDEALELLQEGVPLAGGTRLTASLRGIEALVDLQDLPLDQIEVTESTHEFGGTATLQGLMDNASQLPEALVQAARLEAGWNIRNRATVAGTIVTGDGRSPLLTVLLALGAELELAPGDERISLADALDQGDDRTGGKLITAIRAAISSQLKYAQVARSPVDRPQICVAVAAFDSDPPVRIAIGGYGTRPQLVSMDEDLSIEDAADNARTVYAEAGDQWASADYRSSAAATLVARLLSEVAAE